MNTTLARLRMFVALAALLLACAPTSLRAAGAATAPATLPFRTNPIAQRSKALEQELAGLILKRPDVVASDMPRLDLAIDLRIIEQAVLKKTVVSIDDDAHAAALLRALEIEAAAADLDDALAKLAPNAPNDAQNLALAQLHKLTFDLADEHDSRSLDVLCRDLGTLVYQAGGSPAGPGAALPEMRPPNAPPALSSAEGTAPAGTAPQQPPPPPPARTPATIGLDIRQANISNPLRQQLLVLLDQAGPNATEHAPPMAVILDTLDMIRGLDGISGMDQTTRGQIEAQLTDGLALCTDPRTRAAGEARIASLAQYREMLRRVSSLRISDQQRNQFAPAIAWAHGNVDQAPRALSILEQLADITAQYESLPAPAGPNNPMRQAVDAVRKQFENTRAAAVKDIANLTAAGGLDALDAKRAQLRQAVDTLRILDEMPRTLEVINAYKPRPFNNIERRVAAAAQAMALSTPSPAQIDAWSFLVDLTRVARVSFLLSDKASQDIPPAIAKKYTGQSITDFQSSCNGLVLDLANDAANNRPLDPDKLHQLMASRHLLKLLRTVAHVEASLDKLDVLQRWADWAIDTAQVKALLAAYQDPMFAAFKGVSAGSSQMMGKWRDTYPRYQPVLALIERDMANADFCATLPTGLAGDAARLLTPLAEEPCADERFASMELWVWSQCQQASDNAGMAAALNQLGRLNGPPPQHPVNEADPSLDELPRLKPAPPVAPPVH